MKLVFKDKSQETQKKFLKAILDFHIDKFDYLGKETYDVHFQQFRNGYIDISNYSQEFINSFKDLGIWKEPKIEIGTPCKFWDSDEDNFSIAYYGGDNKGIKYKHTANLVSGESYNSYLNCEPITEIPKYKGAK